MAVVGTAYWFLRRKDRKKSRRRGRSKRGSGTSSNKGKGNDSDQATHINTDDENGNGETQDGNGDNNHHLALTAAELIVFASSCKRRDRLKHSHIKRVIELLRQLLERGTAEESDELECSLLFRCIVGYTKWRVLMTQPKSKRAGPELLGVQVLNLFQQESRTIPKCASIYSASHGAREALVALGCVPVCLYCFRVLSMSFKKNRCLHWTNNVAQGTQCNGGKIAGVSVIFQKVAQQHASVDT